MRFKYVMPQQIYYFFLSTRLSGFFFQIIGLISNATSLVHDGHVEVLWTIKIAVFLIDPEGTWKRFPFDD